MAYTPPKQILENYAKVLVNFALNSGEGIKPGEVVCVQTSETAKPLYAEVLRQIWRSGGHVIERYVPDNDQNYNLAKDFFEIASDDQINYFPEKYLGGLVDQIDHQIFIGADVDPKALEGVDPKKLMQHGLANKPYYEMRADKENAGKYTWTYAIYGTEGMAQEAGLSAEEYWQQIINACYLDETDPVAKWRQVSEEIQQTQNRLNALKIKSLHVEGEDVDLNITIGERRRWMGGSGRNIPSFEVFTCPDWRGTNGWIRFNQPLYRYGNMVKGIYLKFEDGRVVESSAEQNESVLKEMTATENADKVGEFSLTDSRLSRITKFMAHTLFDENMGGRFGNTHIALGDAYHDVFDGDPTKMSKDDWAELGFNNSSVHTDMISTTDRTVTATLEDGAKQVIYKDGEFTL